MLQEVDSHIKTISIQIGLLSVAAVVMFYVSNYFLDGYLRSPVSLGQEIKSPVEALYEYRLSKESPFKYRMLFSGIVKGTFQMFTPGGDSHDFYRIYKFWSLAFYVTSVLAFFCLLWRLGYRHHYPLIGSLIFLVLPPMLMAFTLPVHTREDTLAYTILFLGLVAIVENKRWILLIVAVVGVFTRETLLLLPLLYLLFVPDSIVIRKLLIAGIPFVVWLSLRFFFLPDDYDHWVGLRWNLANPIQVFGFLFITFNLCWLPFLYHVIFYRRNIFPVEGKATWFFYRSSVPVGFVILATAFLGGIMNEIRLIYLFAPWIIILFLDFVDRNVAIFKKVLGKRGFYTYAAGVFVLCCFVAVAFVENENDLIEKGKWAIPYNKWLVLSLAYCFGFLLFLPLAFPVFFPKVFRENAQE